jgi:alpha-1,3-rhamnosyltransferase
MIRDRYNSQNRELQDAPLQHDLGHAALVSVLIPLYNHEDYIAECLDSILSQDHSNIEIILVDDASTDNGLQVAKGKLASCGAKHTILENTVNAGICATLNRAVQAAQGQYALIIASDDLLTMGRVKRHVGILEECTNSAIIACHGPLQVMFDDGTLAGVKSNLPKEKHYDLASVVTKAACPSLQGCTFITEKLKKFPFDEALFFEDWDFFIRLFLRGYGVLYDEAATVQYRQHADGANRRVVEMIQCRQDLRNKHLKDIAERDPNLARSFEFTIAFSNLMSISYAGKFAAWSVNFLRLLAKEPKALIARGRTVAWSFRNLIRSNRRGRRVRD